MYLFVTGTENIETITPSPSSPSPDKVKDEKHTEL